MKRVRSIKVWGLALMAMLVLSGIAAASASATQPKASGAPATFSGTGGAGKLETVEPTHTVSCTGNTSAGEINSETSVKGVRVIFTGCTASGPFGINLTCTSAGAKSGEIQTVPLKGELVYLVSGSSRAGMDLKPESGSTFASFTCTGFLVSENISVAGSVIGEITPVNTATNKFTLTFKQSKGIQEFQSYLNPSGCSAVKDVLSTSGSGSETFGPLQSAVEGTETVTTSKNITIASSKCS